jgi:uncharacterized membrane protein YgaE (UPF0421/DUF939 family)
MLIEIVEAILTVIICEYWIGWPHVVFPSVTTVTTVLNTIIFHPLTPARYT